MTGSITLKSSTAVDQTNKVSASWDQSQKKKNMQSLEILAQICSLELEQESTGIQSVSSLKQAKRSHTNNKERLGYQQYEYLSAASALDIHLSEIDERPDRAPIEKKFCGDAINSNETSVAEHSTRKIKNTPVKKMGAQYSEQLMALCHRGQWLKLQHLVTQNNPFLSHEFKQSNQFKTTLLHMAIVAKGKSQERFRLIKSLLINAPQLAKVPNSMGSLPLHQLLQRNVNLKSTQKVELAKILMALYPQATLVRNNNQRTPIHIALTDYTSSELLDQLLETGHPATHFADKQGLLPIHIACSRHCSISKLTMLIEVNPKSLFAKTATGETPLSLAMKTATPEHPNQALIQAIQGLMKRFE